MRLALATLTAASTLMLTGCSQVLPVAAPPAPVTDELSLLTSSVNNLTYPPYLRSEPAPAPDQGYDARTAALLGTRTTPSVAAARRTRLEKDASQFGPISGRWLLLPLGVGFKPYTGALNPAQSLGRSDGSFVEPGANGRADVAETTARMVELATAADDRALTNALRGRTANWLSRAAHSSTLAVAAPAAEALRLLLGHKVSTTARFRAPDTSDFSHLDDGRRAALLDDTYDYVRLRHAEGRRPDVDADVWLHVLDANVSTAEAPELFELTAVLRGAGVPRERLSTITQRLEANHLPNGLYRDPSMYAGDPSTTMFALALRHQAGESMADTRLADGASKAVRQQPRAGGALKFVLGSLAALTRGGDATSAARGFCAKQQTVGIAEVPSWTFEALTCRLDGVPIAMPSLVPWSTRDAHGIVEAAHVVVALDDLHRLGDVPAWLRDAVAAAPQTLDPARLGGLRNAVVVLAAIRALHGTVAPVVANGLSRYAARSLGCPGYPDLYRALPDDPFGCDLATTLAVRRYLDPAIQKEGSDE